MAKEATTLLLQEPQKRLTERQRFFQSVKQHKVLLLMLLPGLVFVLLFNYAPLYGIQIAFKDYIITKGIWESPWVGLKHVKRLFSHPAALDAIKNTIAISLYRLLWGFPAPIILAVFLNEIGNKSYKKVSQTITYLPHFLSWIVLAGMLTSLLSSKGAVNSIIEMLGGQPIMFLTSEKWFRTILVITNIWKEIGWGSIIYLAAISGIDAEQYEAAVVDGATRLQRIWQITLPSMIPLISTVLILNMGGIMNAGFDQIFNLINVQVRPVAEIIDTFVYEQGIVQMNYSFSAAVGLFKSLVGLILMITVQAVTTRLSKEESGLW